MPKYKIMIFELITRCGKTLSRIHNNFSDLLKPLLSAVSISQLVLGIRFNSSKLVKQQTSVVIPLLIIGVNRMLYITKATHQFVPKSIEIVAYPQVLLSNTVARVGTVVNDLFMKLRIENQIQKSVHRFNQIKFMVNFTKLVHVFLVSLTNLVSNFSNNILHKIMRGQLCTIFLVVASLIMLHSLPTFAQTAELPQLSIANTKFYVGEDVGNSGYNLELVLSKAPLQDQDVSISYAVTAGTAIADTDFSFSGDSVVFDADMAETSKTINISIMDNELEDGNRFIRFTLSNLSGAEFSGGGVSLTRTIVIVDDEPTTFSLSSTNFRVDESATSRKIDVEFSITPVSQYDVTYTVSTEDGTALKGLDYTELTTQTVTIPAGSTTSTVSIPILNDNSTEGEQSFILKAENVVGAVITGDTESIEQMITIVDDEAATIFLDDILNAENIIEGYGNYSMNLSSPSAVSSSVNISYSITALTATSGTDYTAPANQTITIANGSDNVSLSGFTIPNNTAKDGDKTFRINLSITSGSAVFSGGVTQKQITMTIVDDDSLVLTVSRPGDQYVSEDIGNVSLNYTLATAISSTITFDVALSDGVRRGFFSPEATFGTDYGSEKNFSITISAGETNGSILIPILEDESAEVEEGFTVTLDNLTHAIFDNCPVTQLGCTPNQEEFYFFITENDKPTLSFANDDFTVQESPGGANFDLELQLSNIAPNHAIFNFEYTDDSAREGVEYRKHNREFEFIYRGELMNRNMIRIPILYDSNYTGNKTFTISVVHFNSSPYKPNFPVEDTEVNDEGEQVKHSKVITIVDNEAPEIEITTTDFTVAENVSGGNLVVNYRLLSPGTTTLTTATKPVSFEYNLIDGTTTKNSDFTEVTNRTETIAIGGSTGSFSIPITDDSALEGNETFNLELSNLVNASIFTGSSITHTQEVIIVDNELPTLSIANTPLSVVENVGAEGLVVEGDAVRSKR